MGEYREAFWESHYYGGSRKQRASGAYRYYIPSFLATQPLPLDGDVVADVVNASNALAELKATAAGLHSTEGIARLLLRAEAVSSSFIEGLTVGTRRILKAEIDVGNRLWKPDETAATIVGNIHAMQSAIDEVYNADFLTVDSLLSIHRKLCESTPIEKLGGAVRDQQNWVGGNSYNPLEASYVPPAPEHVPELLADLATFLNRSDVAPVVKAALAHAQFESIHPFIDGNGRTGRALIYSSLKRDGAIGEAVPPISLIMATHSDSYVQALDGFRAEGADMATALNEWVSYFSGAVADACDEALLFEKQMEAMRQNWLGAIGKPRNGSALDLLLERMVGMPLFTPKMASEAIGRSSVATNAALDALASAGIIKEVSAKQRNRVYEVPDVIEAFNIYERKLASPVGNTAAEPPSRPVPAKL